MLNTLNPDHQEYHQFRALNQQVLAELMTFIDFAEGFTLGFIEINFPPNVDILIRVLSDDPKCPDIQFEVFDFSHRPDLRFLRDDLLQQLPERTRHPNTKFVLLVKGLEKSIGVDMDGEYPPVLQDLNYVRDAYKRSFSFPVLFVLPDYAITRLARFASDFWAWRSGVFLFQTPPVTKDYMLNQSMDLESSFGLSKKPESQERIEMLKGLLMEFSPSSGHPITVTDLDTCNTLLYQLGVAYLSQHNAAKAQGYLQKALEKADQRMDLSLQAEVSLALGRALLEQRMFADAQIKLNVALERFRHLEDPQGEIGTLLELGRIEVESRNFSQAESYFQQCLSIDQDLGDWRLQARTYHQLGRVAQAQRRYEEAKRYYRKALEIVEQAGDVYSSASTYHNLGSVAQEQRQYEEAERYYRKALEITEQAGDVYETAGTYHQLGSVAQAQGNLAEAFPYFLKAFQIFLDFGDQHSSMYPFRQFLKITQTQGAETFTQLWQDSAGDPCPDWILEKIQQIIQTQSEDE